MKIVLVVLCLLWPFVVIANKPVIPCHRGLTTDITNGTRLPNNFIKHNNITYPPWKYYKENNDTVIKGCTCDLVPSCFRKCCPHGQTYIHGKCSNSNHTLATNFVIPVYEEDMETSVPDNFFTVVHSYYCQNQSFLLDPDYVEGDLHYFQSNGSLYRPYAKPNYLPPQDFCLEFFEDYNMTSALVCFPDAEETTLQYSIGKIRELHYILFTFAHHYIFYLD